MMRVAVLACLVIGLGACATGGDPAGDEVPVLRSGPPATGAAERVPQPSDKGIRLPEFERVQLPSGTVLLLAEKRDVPLVAVQATLRGGAVADPNGKAGLAALTASLLEKGAGDRDARQFAEAVAAVGGVLSAGSGVEAVQIAGEFLAADVDLMLELLSDMLLRPRFDDAEFDKLRRRSIELIKSAKDSDPRRLIGSYGSAYLFAGHPYGRPSGGDETTLAAITPQDVDDYYRRQIGGDRLIVSVVGDFDVDAVRAKLTERFGSWRAAQDALPVYADHPRQTGGRVLLVDKPDATQTYFWIGNTGVSRSYPRRGPLDVVNTVFGGRFTSMLNTALRIESGLTYGARSRISRPSRSGSVAIVSYTATESTVAAIDLSLATLQRLQSDGLSDAQTVSAKNYILGQHPPGFETARQLSAQLATLEFYELRRDYIDGYAALIANATPAQIAAAIDEVYPEGDELVLVMIGAADRIRDQVAKYGEITEMPITAPTFYPPGPR